MAAQMNLLLTTVADYNTRDKLMKAWQFGIKFWLAYGPLDKASSNFQGLEKLAMAVGSARAPWRILNEWQEILKFKELLGKLLQGDLSGSQKLDTLLNTAKAALMLVHWTTGHLSFFQKTGLITKERSLGRTAAELNKLSMTVWGIVCLINTYQTGVQLQTLPFNKMTERKEAMITQIRNVADVLTAGGATGYLPLSDGQTSFFALLSSIIFVQRKYVAAAKASVGNKLKQ